MAYLKFSQLQKIFFVALMVVAQHSPLLAQKAPPPPDNGAPTQREGAATRGPCVQKGDKRLTALVPLVQYADRSQDANYDVVLGKTAALHPSFWFYVPYILNSDHPVEFLLRDEAGKEIYQASLKSSETEPGVVGFQLPATVPALEVGKRYQWFFSVYCTSEVPILVTGWVERVEIKPSLLAELEQATPREQVALYQKANLWHEAITTLAQLRRQKPDDDTLKTEWLDLLQSIGLKAIAPEPLTAMLSQTSKTSGLSEKLD